MPNKVEIHGYCEKRFKPVKDAFVKNFEQGLEVGASFAIILDGELLIDIWAGHADAARTRLWEQDTIVNVYSTTKVITTLCALMLVDRGLLDLDAPVAKYWPEFAQRGKAEIPVRYLLSHMSGLAGFSKSISVDTLYDWDRIINLLASQKPWWQPGTKSGYHVVTFGYLLGELIRRVTGKTVGSFLRDEITDPLNIDFHIGLSAEHDFRVAELIPDEIPIPQWKMALFKLVAKLPMKALMNPPISVELSKTRAWRAAEIPAANGHGNARSIARIGSILASGGEINNNRFLSLSTIEEAIKEQYHGPDVVFSVLGVPKTRWGLGVGLSSEQIPLGPRGFYWGGWGGSAIVMDLDQKLSIGYAMNKMNSSLTGDTRITRLVEALVQCLTEI
ncbi:MAG: serine hydrolase domain-containing protein [Candidatus Hermodarchaeota archaeon]